MDHQTFDRLTRLFGASGTRRTAWRALLAAALLGTTTRTAAATPCASGKNPRCQCGTDTACEPGKCFTRCGREVCCTGRELIICGNTCCQALDARGTPLPDPCTPCTEPPLPAPSPGQPPCSDAVTGTYRRR